MNNFEIKMEFECMKKLAFSQCNKQKELLYLLVGFCRGIKCTTDNVELKTICEDCEREVNHKLCELSGGK